MKSLQIDLGSEFDNKKVIKLAEKYAFEIDPTPGGAHWAGGGYQRTTWPFEAHALCHNFRNWVSSRGLPSWLHYCNKHHGSNPWLR